MVYVDNIQFSVAKATLHSQMSVRSSVTETLKTSKHQSFHLITIIITILTILTSLSPLSSVHHPSTFLKPSYTILQPPTFTTIISQLSFNFLKTIIHHPTTTYFHHHHQSTILQPPYKHHSPSFTHIHHHHL